VTAEGGAGIDMETPDRMRAWVTGLNRIQSDHDRLHKLLNELHDVCCEFYFPGEGIPERQEIASCEGRLNSFSHEFIDFLVRHFEREERWMVDSTGNGVKAFRAHQQDHLRVIRTIEGLLQNTIFMTRENNAIDAVLEFHQCVHEVLEEHAQNFDALMIERSSGTF
jgi:hemerythrin